MSCSVHLLTGVIFWPGDLSTCLDTDPFHTHTQKYMYPSQRLIHRRYSAPKLSLLPSSWDRAAKRCSNQILRVLSSGSEPQLHSRITRLAFENPIVQRSVPDVTPVCLVRLTSHFWGRVGGGWSGMLQTPEFQLWRSLPLHPSCSDLPSWNVHSSVYSLVSHLLNTLHCPVLCATDTGWTGQMGRTWWATIWEWDGCRPEGVGKCR